MDNFNLKTDAYDSSIKYFDPSRIDYDFATTDYSITEEEKHSTSDSDYLNSDLKQLFSQKIYEVLIKTKYRNSNFNANFWDYDADGNLLSGDGNKTVVATIDGVQRILYSVRLPYFKNYFNTTFKIVNEVVNSEASFETKTQWELIHGSAYPYDDEYPSVPLTYFADYDNGDMLFDGKSSCAKMFSGYQNYQSMVLMPQKTVELDSGALFITRQLAEDEAHFEDGSTDGYGDFELTIYARFYDASTQSYAMWEGEDGTFSEFYIIDTITVLFDAYEEGPEEDMEEDEEPDEDIPDDEEDYEPDNPDDEENDPGAGLTNLTPNVVDFSIKKILKSAFVNGTQVESNLLEGFDENSVLSKHHSTLITKENYGYLFNYVDTPDGKQVVCFDGKKAGAPSYFELVFSCPEDCKFQFCFYPTVAFDPQVA